MVKVLMLSLVLLSVGFASELKLLDGILKKSNFKEAFCSKFSQERKIDGFKFAIKSEGVFCFDHSKGVLWKQKTPFKSEFYIGKEKLIEIDPSGKKKEIELSGIPLVGNMTSIFLSLFSGEKSELLNHFGVELKGSEKKWELELTPKSLVYGQFMNKIVLNGTQYIDKVTIVEKSAVATILFTSQLPAVFPEI